MEKEDGAQAGQDGTWAGLDGAQQQDLVRGLDAPLPFLQHKPSGDKITSKRQNPSDCQHPALRWTFSAARFLRNTTAVGECLREGWAELSLQPRWLR